MNMHVTRAACEVAIEDFGRARIAEAAGRLLYNRGVEVFTPDAQAELLAMLNADFELHERINAQNRALRESAQADRAPSHGVA